MAPTIKNPRVKELAPYVFKMLASVSDKYPLFDMYRDFDRKSEEEIAQYVGYCNSVEELLNFPQNLLRLYVIDQCYKQDLIIGEEAGRSFSYNWTNGELVGVSKESVIKIYMPLWKKYGNRGDMKAIGDMDDIITIYRGIKRDEEEDIRSFSWTTSRDVATFFATQDVKKEKSEEGYLITGRVHKKHVVAFLRGEGCERKEEEIVIDDPYKINIINKEVKHLEDFIRPWNIN